MHSSGIKQARDTEQILREIFNSFEVAGNFKSGTQYGSGHIHDTFLVETSGSGTDNYIVQRLNHNVFKKIPEMQENIERVTGHIRSKLLLIPGADLKRECLTFMRSHDNKTWIRDKSGYYWRISLFITDHRSYDLVDTPGKAFEGGRAIGKFQAMLSDLRDEPLHETIPFFHHIGRRLETLRDIIKDDPAERVKSVKPEIDYILERSESMQIVIKLGEEGKIPLRTTHNDTKFNNILFDLNDKALCVIDLDTVMPGYVHNDFGDAIRTAANTGAEDDENLSNVMINMEVFKAYAAGYLRETKDTLNSTEKEFLAFAPLMITYNQAVRFLTDYIDGDSYYKIHYPNHNLLRTRAQIQLVKSMEANYKEMQSIVRELS